MQVTPLPLANSCTNMFHTIMGRPRAIGKVPKIVMGGYFGGIMPLIKPRTIWQDATWMNDTIIIIIIIIRFLPNFTTMTSNPVLKY